MRHAFERILEAVRVVVERVDAPRVARPVMVRVLDADERRVTHLHVRGCHVDASAKDLLTVLELASTHPPVEIEIFRNRPPSVRALLAVLRDGAAVLLREGLLRQITDVRAAELEQLL